MDALTDVLKAIRLNASTYFCSDFRSPWGMDVGGGAGMFHVVVEGTCWLLLDGESTPRQLVAGDIVAFPTGGEHWMGDSADVAARPHLAGDKVVEGILSGQHPFPVAESAAESDMTLMCGSFTFDSSISHPLIRDLPCFIQLSTRESKLGWLDNIVQVMARESRSPSPGSEVVIDRLSEILFIELLRQDMQSQSADRGYLSALNDRVIGHALNVIHDDAMSVKGVEALATEVGLSRSAFTDRFTQLVGQSPKQYLTDWRMHQAKAALQGSEESMLEIAEQAGFSSEAAFSKAFKKFFHETPGAIRRAFARQRKSG
ncbi:RCS-specific HTH-type transcriptional activator RclR [BD1-7 clade bacterium]|uniref:RCS-specific HTH-type transcriptional activator RclR n=1 Tax=BD1-7 clade bacterium TaxID=2029982 RepID=A0A5S9PBE2_9GAMM|nr:RCS-specific HTH-type transcriptional activator RclR [BD1-7 clade bacterium]CAA0116560.1 RCS-specific HTH-type transcriptional activator RclR [BD1-7 clade bacterium]